MASAALSLARAAASTPSDKGGGKGPAKEKWGLSKQHVSDDRAVDIAEQMAKTNESFSAYLQQYTKASVNLLRRWPAFVPEEERYADVLEPGTAAAHRVFGVAELPADGQELDLRGRPQQDELDERREAVARRVWAPASMGLKEYIEVTNELVGCGYEHSRLRRLKAEGLL